MNAVLRYVVRQAKAGSGYDNFTSMSQQSRRFFNATFNYDQLTVTTSTSAASRQQDDLGVLASMNAECNIYGVKSDRGTTDGYIVLPLTANSTRFFIAAWPSVSQTY